MDKIFDYLIKNSIIVLRHLTEWSDLYVLYCHYDQKFWFEVFIYGGKKGTGLDVIEWAKKIEELGAGEILLTSIDKDGTKDGYDILLTNEIVHAVGIPVIASGGCGKPEDMVEIFKKNEASILYEWNIGIISD